MLPSGVVPSNLSQTASHHNHESCCFFSIPYVAVWCGAEKCHKQYIHIITELWTVSFNYLALLSRVELRHLSQTVYLYIFSLNHEQFPSYTPCCSPVGYQPSWIWGVNQDKTCHTRHTNTITELYSFLQHHVAPSQVVLWKQMHHHIPYHHTSWAMLTACICMCLHRHACPHTHVIIPENDGAFPIVHFACFTCCHGNNGGFARPWLAMDDKYIATVLALQVVRCQLQMLWKNIHLFDDWCGLAQVIMSQSMCACMHVSVQMCMCVCVYVCLYMCMCVSTCVRVCVSILPRQVLWDGSPKNLISSYLPLVDFTNNTNNSNRSISKAQMCAG